MGRREEIGRGDATAQAALVRTKAVQPMEVVEAASERSERVNPALHAVVTPRSDQARAARGPIPAGPFAGVPFLLKDFLADVTGVRFTEGVVFLQDYIPTEDSELVTRYKWAGLLIIGKTNLPALALGATTEPQLFGPTHNPWDLTRTPGGSSGGAAAAVDGSKRSARPRLDDPHAQRVGGGTAGVAVPHRPGGRATIATARFIDTDPFTAENTCTLPRDGSEGRSPLSGRSDRSQAPDDRQTSGEDGTGA